jgi:hypothetical protein
MRDCLQHTGKLHFDGHRFTHLEAALVHLSQRGGCDRLWGELCKDLRRPYITSVRIHDEAQHGFHPREAAAIGSGGEFCKDPHRPYLNNPAIVKTASDHGFRTRGETMIMRWGLGDSLKMHCLYHSCRYSALHEALLFARLSPSQVFVFQRLAVHEINLASVLLRQN